MLRLVCSLIGTPGLRSHVSSGEITIVENQMLGISFLNNHFLKIFFLQFAKKKLFPEALFN